MIPLRHTLPGTRIAGGQPRARRANVVVFIVQLFLGPRTERSYSTFGFIPARLVHPSGVSATRRGRWRSRWSRRSSCTAASCTSLGNMIYLWVFGGAIEDNLGHVRYFFFYIACGAVGSLTHTLLFPQSPVPSIGASGSIAGVLGAFLVLRPHARIVTLFPLVVYWAMAEIPRHRSFCRCGSGCSSSTASSRSNPRRARTQEVAGIAWWAHVGGFVFGAAVAGLWRLRARRQA
jgi:membrane associated rhomboid family serine protease